MGKASTGQDAQALTLQCSIRDAFLPHRNARQTPRIDIVGVAHDDASPNRVRMASEST